MISYMKTHRFLLRLPEVLHQRALKKAASSDKSLNQFIEEAVTGAVSRAETISLGAFDPLVRSARSWFNANLVGVILFGSQARGDTHDSSDTDVLIVIRDTVALSRELYRKELPVLEGEPASELTLHYAHLPASPKDAGSLWLECALDGVIILDSDRTIQVMLSQIRRVIASGAVIRKISHGQGSWVHI